MYSFAQLLVIALHRLIEGAFAEDELFCIVHYRQASHQLSTHDPRYRVNQFFSGRSHYRRTGSEGSAELSGYPMRRVQALHPPRPKFRSSQQPLGSDTLSFPIQWVFPKGSWVEQSDLYWPQQPAKVFQDPLVPKSNHLVQPRSAGIRFVEFL